MLKKALIVFAHPNLKSYCGALRDTSIQQFNRIGVNVMQSDLYQMNFNPVLTFGSYNPAGTSNVNINEQVKQAIVNNNIDTVLQAEIDKVKAADYLIFIAPTWWGTFPAIMKGWLERVLAPGVAADLPHNMYKKAYFLGKKSMIVTTTGFGREYFSKEGKHSSGQTLEENYWHIINGVFAYCGMDTLPLVACYGMDNSTEKQRKDHIEVLRRAIEDIEKTKPIYCPLLHDPNQNA